MNNPLVLTGVVLSTAVVEVNEGEAEGEGEEVGYERCSKTDNGIGEDCGDGCNRVA